MYTVWTFQMENCESDSKLTHLQCSYQKSDVSSKSVTKMHFTGCGMDPSGLGALVNTVNLWVP